MKIEVFVDDIKGTKCKTTCVMVDGVPIEQLSEEEELNLRLRLANKLRTSEDIDVRDIAGGYDVLRWNTLGEGAWL